MSINEIRQVYKVAPEHIQKVLVLGISTGVRIGPSELFKLKWSDIDFDKNIIYISNADKGVNNSKRIVPIRTDIRDILFYQLHRKTSPFRERM